MRFSGMSVLVTGGTGGIGWGIVEAFVSEGATLIATGLTQPEVDMAEVKVEGRPIVTTTLDVTDRRAVDAFVAGLARLDFLVNCAGIIRRRDEYDLDTFEHVLAVNLTGTMRMCQAVRPLLGARGGAIVNVASMYSFFGAGHAPGYAASKGGVAQVTKSLAREYALENIRVNAVAPGWIKTAITEPVFSNPLRSAPIVDRTPLGRWGEPRDVAGPVLFLCSTAAAFVTGAVLPVDGGYLLTG